MPAFKAKSNLIALINWWYLSPVSPYYWDITPRKGQSSFLYKPIFRASSPSGLLQYEREVPHVLECSTRRTGSTISCITKSKINLWQYPSTQPQSRTFLDPSGIEIRRSCNQRKKITENWLISTWISIEPPMLPKILLTPFHLCKKEPIFVSLRG